jgi:2-succinyl-5-enolpyruvyl-6-hydroxy-3-cyclohexene-1-carboxylate synthase
MMALNPSQALASTIVDELVRHGVVHVCMAPGSRSAPLSLALAARNDLQLNVLLDERSAAFFALGTARASGMPGAVVCTSGPAAANFLPAIVEAGQDRVPLIVLTADRPEELRNTGANQTIDQTKLYGDAVRFWHEIGAPGVTRGPPAHYAYWRSVTSRAVAAACGSPQGPVHLNLCFRDPLVGESPNGIEPEGSGGGSGPWTRVSTDPRVPGRETVSRLADLARSHERGVLLAGATRLDATPALDFARHVAWPVLAEPASGLRRGPLAISTYESLLRADDFARRHRPEVVVQVGKTGLSRALARWLDRDVQQVLVDPDGTWLDPQRNLSEIVVASPACTFETLTETAPERTSSEWLRAWLEAESRARAAIDTVLDESEKPSEPRAARDLADLLPPRSRLVVGSSLPVRDLDATMRPTGSLRVLGNRGVNGIDGFVSTAVGVAHASEGPVAALCGDLTLLHDQNGLLAARSVDIVFVVLDNDGGGIFSFLEQASHPNFERLFGTPQGVDLARVASVYGLGHHRIELAGDLVPVVDAAFSAGGAHLVVVPSDRASNAKVHRRMWAAVSDSL